MLDRIRRRLTIGYAGILALILILFGCIVVLSFQRQVTVQQNRLLEQRVESLAKDPYYGSGARILEDPDRYAWVILTAEGHIRSQNPTASALGLPSEKLFEECISGLEVVSGTVDRPAGNVRVASAPISLPRSPGSVGGLAHRAGWEGDRRLAGRAVSCGGLGYSR